MRIVAMFGTAAAMAALALGLVSGGSAAPAQRDGGIYRVAALAGGFGAIDPALTGSPLDATVLYPACGALMLYPSAPVPEGLRLRPDLAVADPVVSKDRRTYTFTIRDGVRFSNGVALTARDFKYTFERIFTPVMHSTYVGFAFDDIVGAAEMLDGKATSLRGVVAKGRTLTITLTRPTPDLPARVSLVCVVPFGLAIDAEGARAPIPSPAPYYFAEYVPGERVVLQENRFYRGWRPHHVDRITVDLRADLTAVDRVAKGEFDTVISSPDFNPRLPELAARYGVNKARFFRIPGLATRAFFMNTSRPLFRNNVKLRQALNFAVDRRALTREFGQLVASTTDQWLPPIMPGFRDERIYPLKGPNLEKARALAKGRTRSGKAVLYTCSRPDCLAAAQILQANVKPLGLEIEVQQFPGRLLFEKLGTPGEPYDLTWFGWSAAWNDPLYFLAVFDGRTAHQPGTDNSSQLDSPSYTKLLQRASRLTGAARYEAFGELDVQLTRDLAPVIAYMNVSAWVFVSARTGCVVLNPYFDLTSVCLK